MNQQLARYLAVFLFFISLGAAAQMSDKEKFTESLYLMDEKRFSEALPMLLDLSKKDPENANLNYNIGVAILNSFDEKEKKGALPYLEKAAKNVSPNYTPYSHKEKKAPVDAWYYLGEAQHSDYQFLEAKESFSKFRTYINDKHNLWKEIDKKIRMAEYAQVAIMNPVNIKTTNLGGELNGFYPDFSPVVRIDESAIYFTSRRLREDSSNYSIYDPIDGMMFEDIYVSFNTDGKWGEAYPLNINTDGHEATLNLSVDGQTLYIYKDINGNGELFESHLENDSAGFETWSTPEKLGSDINSKYYETHVAISPDEKMLYFISDREGGFGGKDIYFCRKLPTGDWALSQNAGPVLNTEFDEDGVFMHPDGKTLYFSSNGHESMGGYDIMYSTFTDSGWTKPTNIGYPINSVDDDVFFVTTPDGKRAYYSSFKEQGYGEKDIYLLELIDAEEVALTLYRGEFTFVDRYVPPSGALVTILNNYTGELVGSYTPRQRDGQFSAILASNNSYHFIYEADGYESYEEDIYVPAGFNYQEIYKDIKLRPVRVGRDMEGMVPAELALADIEGQLSKTGKPLSGMKILLMDEGENLIQKTESSDLGEFQFMQLDPSQTYLIRVIAEDGNPLQRYNVNVINDQGEELVFEPLDDTTYIFVPSASPYEFYGIKAKSLAGTVKSADEPVRGLVVRLEDEDNNLIQQNETDEMGQFEFQKLNLDNEYRLVFEGDFPDDPSIIIVNDQNEVMSFEKVREGVYVYVPNKRGQEIVGTVSKDGVPLAGLKVRLENQESSILAEESTDIKGQFNFTELDLEKSYRIVFEGDFPDDTEIILKDEFGRDLVFVQVGEGIYEYMPEGKPLAGSNVNGVASKSGAPIAGLKVRLEDNEQTVLQQEETDNMGSFSFDKLNLDETYRIVFEGDFPDGMALTFRNEKGEELTFVKVEEGVYEYTPKSKPALGTAFVGKVLVDGQPVKGLDVKLEDGQNMLIQQDETDQFGEFNFQQLDLNETYRIVFEGDLPDDAAIVVNNEYGQELTFRKVEKGVYEYIPRSNQYKFNSYTIDVEGVADYKETYPRPEELKDVIAYFQKYFPYNAKDINESNKEFKMFINDIAELVKQRGNANVIITSSASKVPTRTWKTNSILTKRRAYDTKRLLEKIFKEKGLEPSQYNFVDINTLITGPEYKNDYIENRATYEKHQYVRIFIK
jgi:hypothetical protein